MDINTLMIVKTKYTQLIIDRGMAEKLATIVMEHEIPILEAVHGESNVRRHTPVDDDVTAWDALTQPAEVKVREEYDRLCRKYGKHPDQNAFHVDLVYGRYNEATYARIFGGSEADVPPMAVHKTRGSAAQASA